MNNILILLLLVLKLWNPLSTEENKDDHLQPYPENPHYLAWGDVPIFPLGPTDFHSWTPVSRPGTVDFIAHMGRLAEMIDEIGSPNLKGFVRILPYDPMNHLHDGPVERTLQPWVLLEDGRYDLTQFEPEWEERFVSILDAALSREIVVSLEVWDDWSITRGPGGEYDPGEGAAWNAHPFNPLNNINYEESVLPAETSVCEAPFYNTIPSLGNNKPVLDLQKKYVNKLLEIASAYPNLIINIANESRAHLAWSRYWAEYIRGKVPPEFMIGDMPSTNRQDGGGECDHAFNPATLAIDSLYDFSDMSQAISRHEFGANANDQALGGAIRIKEYRQAMAKAFGPRPLMITKDYTRGEDGGDVILWSRLIGGASSARFHRPGVDSEGVVEFQREAALRLGKFIAEIPFWNMNPAPEFLRATDEEISANILAENHGHVVVQLLESKKDQRLFFELEPGTWSVRWIDPATGQVVDKGSASSENNMFEISIPVDLDHLVLHLSP
ncbi:MAG: hypothetical protein WD037_09505 [Balneolales bacterium]